MLAKKAGALKRAETADRSGPDFTLKGPPAPYGEDDGFAARFVKSMDDPDSSISYPWRLVVKKGHVFPKQQFADGKDLEYTFNQVKM